ncbi:hypothetical protein BD410DRAFT_746742 [Rickenella mellea]|uniref:Methyltransferase-domain-containing protein n=1 Tax=Rickenella mellea TaxID=50990 RepID=A0A4Y7Q935_9AGAM|nr:hypothetical protein BD410DRAFT_746742 [Rickenella mellea]
MFYYLSFLKPPPREASLTQPIPITVQIANDLRTELCPREIDVHYCWINSSTTDSLERTILANENQDASGQRLGNLASLPLIKLTTWREANAYKEVRVPPPRDVRNGQLWRLLLCTKPDGIAVIDLSIKEFGKLPFPVLSMPMSFSSRATVAKQAAKQEQIERLFNIHHDSSVLVNIREQLSFDLDKKIWDSGVGLCHWMASVASGTTQSPTLSAILFGSEDRTIFELGAGTGLVSIALAALRSRSSNASRAKIFTTDLPSAMEVIDNNISSNSHLYPDIVPQALVLDWDDEHLPPDLGSKIDLIIMADVTYNTSSFPSLVATLERLKKVGREPPAVLLAYKERDAAERDLWNQVTRIGLELHEIDRVNGAGGAPIEIYFGTFKD